MRCNLDGSNVETLVDTSRATPSRPDATQWCVGIALDVDGGKIYWTQKGGDNAGQVILPRQSGHPEGRDASEPQRHRGPLRDLPEPIDLDLDIANRMMYWTDRGDPPRGNSVNRAPMDVAPGKNAAPEIVVHDLMEGIGLFLDLKGGRMFFADFGGSIYSANLDGSDKKTLLFAQGNLAGIAYAEVPAGS